MSKMPSALVHRIKNYINGEFLDPKGGKFLDSYNPSTAKLIATVPDSGEDDVDAAVRAASEAYPKWAKSTRGYRANLLNKLADLIEINKENFASLESQDQGKTIKQALEIEIPRCSMNLRFYASKIQNFSESSTLVEKGNDQILARSIVRHEPMGVVGVISPWNLPLYLLTWKVAPALAMGNCVVAKPSELTSLTAFKLAGLFKSAGFPDGVFNLVFGRGAVTGDYLVRHPMVRAISFTGGTETGSKIAQAAAISTKKVSLELGGKNAAVIFSDCNLDEAVEACVRSSFSNQGEICLCTSRIIVEESIWDAFLGKFVEKVQKLKIGDPLDPESDMGPLISKEHYEKVKSYIDQIKEKDVFYSGNVSETADNQGYYYPPTIIIDQPLDARIMQEEVFGPVVCLNRFKDGQEDKAIEMVNMVKYGLASSVWTENGRKAQRVAEGIKTGVVWINSWMVRDLNTPFGGMKASGYGREGGDYSLEFFSDIKTITTAI